MAVPLIPRAARSPASRLNLAPDLAGASPACGLHLLLHPSPIVCPFPTSWSFRSEIPSPVSVTSLCSYASVRGTLVQAYLIAEASFVGWKAYRAITPSISTLPSFLTHLTFVSTFLPHELLRKPAERFPSPLKSCRFTHIEVAFSELRFSPSRFPGLPASGSRISPSSFPAACSPGLLGYLGTDY